MSPRAAEPRSGPAAWLAPAWLALALALGAPAAHAQGGDELPDQLRTIAGVKFQGLRHLGRRELKQAGLKTRAPSRLPWKERPALRLDYLRADTAAIAALYRHYGYLDAAASWRLESTRDPTSARVVFVVDEGPRSRVREVQLAGVRSVPEREVRRALLARPGVAFDPAFLALDTVRIANAYAEHGFLAHTLGSWRRDQPDSLAVSVRYDVLEGPQFVVGRIDLDDPGPVRQTLARRELLLKPGEVYRRSDLDRSVERLYETTLYDQVQVTPTRDSAAARVDFAVRLHDRKPRWVDVGVGSGTSDRFRFSGEWGHRNLDTRALSGVLDGALAYYGDWHFRTASASATLGKPWLLGIRLQGQVSPFTLRADDRSEAGLVQHSSTQGVRFSLFRELSRVARLTVSQEIAEVRQSYDSTGTLPDTTRTRISQVIPRYRSTTLRFTLERDFRDDRIAPSRGSYQSGTVELAGVPFRSTSDYRKLQVTSVWYSPLHTTWVLATRVSGGVMRPFGSPPSNFSPDAPDLEVARVPRQNRFFLGGVNSLRGYGENSLPPVGGLAMALANVELRVPVWGPFGVEAFVDAGNVWARAEYIHLSDLVAPWQATRVNDGDVRYVYGLGGRLVLPFGPLRVDLAWSDRPDFPRGTLFRRPMRFAYQFAIGPSF